MTNEPTLSHLDEHGNARMVDVSAKDVTDRTATATATLVTRPDVVARIRKRLADNDPASFIAAYEIFAEADPWVVGRLGEIACPTLVTTGEDDQGSLPAMSRAMAQAIPGARCHIMPGLRHMPMAEAPDVVNRLLLEFLDSLPRKGDAWA